MKKTILTLIISLMLFGCSKNEENTSIVLPQTTVPANLIGSWKFVGTVYYYDLDVPEGHFTPYEIENIKTFNSNNTFSSLEDSENYSGLYNVTSDSLLTLYYSPNPNGLTGGGVSKISLLNETTLEMTCENPDQNACNTFVRYIKVTP